VPAQGSTVVFNEPTGALIRTVELGPDGSATAVVPEGSMATLVTLYLDPNGLDYARLETVTGLRAGDDIRLGEEANPYQYLGDADINIPVLAGAARYEIHTACYGKSLEDVSAPIRVSYDSVCVPAQTTSALAVAFDGADNVLGHTGATSIALSTETTATVNLPLFGSAFEQLTFEVSNAPLGASEISLVTAELRDGFGYYYDGDGSDLTNGAATLGVPRPAGFADAIEYRPCITYASGSASCLLIRESRVPATESVPIDLAPILGEVAALTFAPATEDTFAAATITTSADLGAADAFVLALEWNGPDVEVDWFVTASSAARDFVVPDLPAHLSNIRPNEMAVLDTNEFVAIESDFIVDYDDYRNNWVGRALESENWPSDMAIRFVTGPSGFGNLY